jgi:uncharacterized protein YcgI (DUF1989 family)
MTITANHIEVPAREGRAVRLKKGQRFRVVDVEGGQVGDLFAYNADDPTEYHSGQHTRVHVGRLFPRPGEQFVTNRRRPILTFEEDTSPGIHDLLCAACDPERYAGLGVEGWHASCQENLQKALEAVGFEVPHSAPQPINLFMDIPILEDDRIDFLPTATKAGDYVQMRAELDAVIALSSCPQDILPINSGVIKPLRIEVLD